MQFDASTEKIYISTRNYTKEFGKIAVAKGKFVEDKDSLPWGGHWCRYMAPRDKRLEWRLFCSATKFSGQAFPSLSRKDPWICGRRLCCQHTSRGGFCEPVEAAP